MKTWIVFIVSFLALDLYFQLSVQWAPNVFWKLAAIGLFFPFVYFMMKLTSKGGFKELGLGFHKKWGRNLGFGFLIGFSFWAIKYSIEYAFGAFEIKGVNNGPDMVWVALEIVGGFLLGSLVNDLIVRGFVFAQLKEKISIPWIFGISVFLYSMEDIWMEGFSLSNTLFSVILGLSLTYAFIYTGSIWANTGLHWGLNVCYGMFNGMVGDGSGGIFIIENGTKTIAYELTGYIIPLLMFIFVWKFRTIFYKNLKSEKPPELKHTLSS